MAFVQDFLDDEENTPEQSQQDGQTLTSDNSTSNNLPVASAGTSGSGSSGAEPNTGFTNASKYLAANQDQSKTMADNVVNPVKAALDKTSSDINTFNTNSRKVIDNNTVRDNGTISNIRKSPTTVTKDAYAANTRDYAGPSTVNDLMGYNDLNNAVSANDTRVQGLKTNKGVQNELSNIYGKDRTYGKGEKGLDSFLTSSGPGANSLNSLQDSYSKSNPTTNFQNINTGLGQSIAQAKDTSALTKNTTQQELGNKLGGVTRQIQGTADQVRSENQQASETYKRLAALASGGSPEALSILGISPEMAKYAKDQHIDLAKFIKAPETRQTLGDRVAGNQVADYQALLGLSGGNSAFDFSKSGMNSQPSDYYVDNQGVNGLSDSYKQFLASLPKAQAPQLGEAGKASKAAAVNTPGKLLIPNASYELPIDIQDKTKPAKNEYATTSLDGAPKLNNSPGGVVTLKADSTKGKDTAQKDNDDLITAILNSGIRATF